MTKSLRLNDGFGEPGADSARWQVIEPLSRDGWVKLFDRERHIEEYKSLADLNAAIVAGRLMIFRPLAPSFTAAAQADPLLDGRLRGAMDFVRAVEEVQKRQSVSLATAYFLLKQEFELNPTRFASLPSRATLYRYVDAKRNGLPLLRGDKNKGNRDSRYAPRVTDLIRYAANGNYLKAGSRWTLLDLTVYVNDRAHDYKYLEASVRISKKFILKTIINDLSVDPEIDRMDPKLVAAAKSIGKKRIVTTLPFERVEQDALHLPFAIATRDGPTSNVWVIHAIDCCTGLVLGWYLVVGSPSESDGLRCVERTLFSKAETLKRLGVTTDIDPCGTTSQLIFDNGAETNGERMGRLVRLGIDTLHCKSRHAHGKPFVERLNRSLKEAIQTLPGSTRQDGVDGERDPIKEGDTLITLDELEHWIVRWYFESWANTELKRHLWTDFHEPIKLGNTAACRWRRMVFELGYALPLSPSAYEWRMTLYEHEERAINRKTGISCRGFNYKGANLEHLLRRHGETRVHVLVDPDDYRQVFVDEGERLPLIALTEEFVTDTTPAYSFAQMQVLRRELPKAEGESEAKIKFRRDVHFRSMQLTKAPNVKKPSKAEQNRTVATANKHAQALKRAAERPLPSAGAGRAPGTRQKSAAFSFEDVQPLPVLNRTDGKAQ